MPGPPLLLIDNYDSFTYNLVQRIGELDSACEVVVARNDKITLEDAIRLRPRSLVISPGPCTPSETGVCPDLIGHFRGRIPILGVCLGHQTIAAVHGMIVERHSVLMHGKTSEIHHDGQGIFRGLSNPFTATRYHSLIVRRNTVGEEFEVSAWTSEGEVMGVRWVGDGAQAAPMDGVQFHPESFLTIEGPALLANFLSFGAVVDGAAAGRVLPSSLTSPAGRGRRAAARPLTPGPLPEGEGDSPQAAG